MPREELKNRLKLTGHVFNAALEKLAADGILVPGPKWVARPDHHVRFSPFQQVKVDAVMEKFAAAPYAPPTVKECQAMAGQDVFAALLDYGDLVAVSDEIVFRKADYEAMLEIIRQAIRRNGQVTLAEVRDLLHTSRRYVQALLEHLDAAGITVRSGEARRLKE
jgi:selenocysteine-specific elongation factor